MMTPEQARTAAIALMRPSVEELQVRKRRLQEKTAQRSRFLIDNMPVIVGVIVTVVSMNYLTDSDLLAVLGGIAAANLIGAFVWRR